MSPWRCLVLLLLLAFSGFEMVLPQTDAPETDAPQTDTKGTDEPACGLRPLVSTPRSRIVGGQEALVGAWPWQVSLQMYNDKTQIRIHLCGGSLFTNQWVITASHCFGANTVSYPPQLRVLVGIHKISETPPDDQIRTVSRIITHKNFSDVTFPNDIALVKLMDPVNFTNTIQPVCLPTEEMSQTLSTCFISGWGRTVDSGDFAVVLMEAAVDVIPVSTCNGTGWYAGEVAQGALCAGLNLGGVDSCQGDSGGPLSCFSYDEKKFYLLGITSWGSGCARPNFPGIYTNVSAFSSWIEVSMTEDAASASVSWNVLSWIFFILLRMAIFQIT